MVFETLNYTVADGIATITLQRPEARNAVNSVMSRELPLLWQMFEQDESALVAIITGDGNKTFCSGADLSDLPETDSDGRYGSLESFRWTSLQNKVWKPVICAVNGMTVGGGLHFVADSDIVIAADSATFFDTHVKVGLVAGLEPVSLARKMPMEAVLRMMLVGGNERMSAKRALELGLVGEVVTSAELMARAQHVANMIKTNSPSAIARTKQAIWSGENKGLDDALQNAWDLIMAQNSHPDCEEGARAFLEKRPPVWQSYSRINLDGKNQ
ncbi:enoyl-CoA hydratase/isomerase family protein [Zhongshania aquimaris]|uniref:Enoyl-CoA hydratase/isomerase family protein n=1 Tax=Zhongshania aquimaris TaxID=2857107 RepID=A0ABS6VQB9_9GAMM|nr:enoyl-CoA hydratase-related protein [Zhongshania aquimaris]MBW2939911.1 enoyl-CoA hydratase/isomerase family protein [Zhongshania aquimaris]